MHTIVHDVWLGLSLARSAQAMAAAAARPRQRTEEGNRRFSPRIGEASCTRKKTCVQNICHFSTLWPPNLLHRNHQQQT